MVNLILKVKFTNFHAQQLDEHNSIVAVVNKEILRLILMSNTEAQLYEN